jgi:hypothetical protein
MVCIEVPDFIWHLFFISFEFARLIRVIKLGANVVFNDGFGFYRFLQGGQSKCGIFSFSC